MRIVATITWMTLLLLGSAHAGNLLFADHPLAGKIWDTASHSYLDRAGLVARSNQAGVLLLGETHDNPQHHDYQLQLLQERIEAARQEANMPPALLMEQLNAEDQPVLDQVLASDDRTAALAQVVKLVKFADARPYQPLLAAAVANSLRIIAANVPNQQLQPVIWRGYAAYDADKLQQLAVEAVWSENRQNYLVNHMGGAHCGQLRDELRAGLARSQRLRDALMVDSALSSVAHGVVAIVGSGHARRDIGLPLYFAARAPLVKVLAIGFVEVIPGVNDPAQYEADSATGEPPYDVIWFTPRVERGNPCAELQKGADPKKGADLEKATNLQNPADSKNSKEAQP